MEEKSVIKPFEKMDEYLRSDDNKKRCAPFEDLCKKYMHLYDVYEDSFEKFFMDVSAEEYKREYSKGGATIHRGYYSPSCLDLVVGGCKRGKLLKNITKNNSFDYEYVFDINGNMICSKKYSNDLNADALKNKEPYSIETFVYDQNKILSFEYDTKYRNIKVITECQYQDGLPIRFEKALIGFDNEIRGTVCGLDVEVIEYEDRLMKDLVWYHYTPSYVSISGNDDMLKDFACFENIPHGEILEQNVYHFNRDEEGLLSTYTVESSNMYGELQSSPHLYRVLVKRR